MRISSIVQNLLTNAIKFSPVGGNIKIEATLDSAQSQLTLAVADTGTGMTADVKESLFTMFRSITRKANDLDDRNKLNNNTSGAGLGLTFCKTMIERLGGEIWFNSVMHQGSTFFIQFPVKVATASDLETQKVREKSVESILIEKLQRLQQRATQHTRAAKANLDHTTISSVPERMMTRTDIDRSQQVSGAKLHSSKQSNLNKVRMKTFMKQMEGQ